MHVNCTVCVLLVLWYMFAFIHIYLFTYACIRTFLYNILIIIIIIIIYVLRLLFHLFSTSVHHNNNNNMLRFGLTSAITQDITNEKQCSSDYSTAPSCTLCDVFQKSPGVASPLTTAIINALKTERLTKAQVSERERALALLVDTMFTLMSVSIRL
jgi:hypothetical protein